MATELATAYVTIVPTIKDLGSKLNEAIGSANLEASGQAIGSKLTNGIEKAFTAVSKVALTSLGAIGGGIGALAATGGMTRALNLEQAQTMFKGLKLDWNDYYDTIDGAVQGTAFSLDQAALVAANLAASGVAAGDDMSQALNACVGTAATFGANLGDIGIIFQKVSAKGKLSGDELLQLSERGINATSILAEHLGLTQAEVREMVTQGKIDFQTFSDAMYAAFGDSAKAANETFTGSMANMQSALSRIGAKFATPFKDACIPVFNAVRLALNEVSARLDPLVEKFSNFASVLSASIVDKLTAFTDALHNGASFVDAFKAAFGDVGGIIATVVSGVVAFGAAIGALSTVFNVIPGLSGMFGALSGGAATFGVASAAAKGFGAAVKTLPGMVTGGIKALTGLPSTLSLVATNFTAAAAKTGSLTGAFTTMVPALGAVSLPVVAIVAAIAALAAAFVYLWNTSDEFKNQMTAIGQELMAQLQPAIEQIGAAIQQIAAAVLPAISTVLQALIPVLATIIQSVVQIASVVIPIVAQIAAAIIPVIANILSIIMNVVAQILQFLQPAIQGLADFIGNVLTFIQGIISTAMDIIQGIITAVMAVINGDWGTAWNAISNVASTVWNAIQNVISTVINAISSVIQSVLSAIQSVWNSIWSTVRSVAQSIWSGIQSAISNAINTVKSVVSSALSSISSTWNSIWSNVSSFVSSTWNTVKSTVSSGVSSVISFVGKIPGQIMSLFSNAGSWLINAGKSIIDGLVRGIQGAIGAAKNAVSGAIGAIRNLFPFSPAKEGPFSGHGWVKYSGISIMEALGEGAESALSETVSKFTAMADRVKESFIVDSFDVNTNIVGDPITARGINYKPTQTLTPNDLKSALQQLVETNPDQPINLFIDGKLIASTISGYVDQSISLNATRKGRMYV